MHKSLGNGVEPGEVIKEYGADILRLWATSSDYRTDMRISKDILKQLSDIYLKVRNTARFILGNLDGFDPGNLMPVRELEGLDRWALGRLNDLVARVLDSYEKYEYHPIYHGIHNFCAVEMSSFYFDVIKDRLYCDGRDSASGRSARSAIYTILSALTRLLAPILAFTSEEIWAAMPGWNGESVMLSDMPRPDDALALPKDERERWDALLELRVCANKALELARAEKLIGKPLDAEVTLYMGRGSERLRGFIDGERLDTLFIVSRVNVISGEGEGYRPEEMPYLTIAVAQANSPMCARCWTHGEDVGGDGRYGDLCPRCAGVVSEIRAGAGEV
jgi:isoleucyl-tRNA synthetase